MIGSGLNTLLIFLLLLPTQLRSQPEKKIDWQYEIDLLGKELVQRHCNLFFKTDSARFFRELDRIRAGSQEHSLFEISVELQQVMALMGDAHTRINYHFNIDGGTILPIEYYWFEDGIYVLKCRRIHQEILGKKICSINGFPLAQVIDSLATLVVDENPFLLKSQLPRMLTWTPLLACFGFGGEKGFEVGYSEGSDSTKKVVVIPSAGNSEMVSVHPDKLPLGWQDRKAYFRDQYFPDEKLYYIQYNRCWSREIEEESGTGASALFMPSFREFEKKVFHTIKKKRIEKLVFDMRFNNGGNSSQGTQFINRLSKAKFKGSGHCYVIIGRETFSSAIINTVDFLNMTDAVLVGEGTGGRPNHYGEVKRFVLPESKLVVNYSTEYIRLMDEDPPSVSPDVKTPLFFDQFMRGIDPALEAIRNQPEE